MDISIFSHYYNKILRIYYKGKSDNENKLYSDIFHFCKQNKHLFETVGLHNFTFNNSAITKCDDSVSNDITERGINMPVYFNYVTNDNILYSQIYLQPLKFCNRAQKNIFYDMVKLITDCKQFVYFNIDESEKFKYAILLNTDVIGYIECISFESFTCIIQCFILPEFRKNGIAMFAHILLFSIIPSQLHTVMILSHNIAAIALYTNLGFQLTDKKHSINGIKYDIYEYADHFDKIQLSPIRPHNKLQLGNWDSALEDNFPYRRYYIPSFLIMYNNLIEFYKTSCQITILDNSTSADSSGGTSADSSGSTSADSSGSTSNNIMRATVNKYIATVDRTFPEDYDNADSIVDHFVEHIRIQCAERNEKSPYAIWEVQKGEFLSRGSDVKALREMVYNGARGCNIFNVSLGVFLFSYFKATSLLDCTAGWGDRLIAASIAGVKFYRGWDTNDKLQDVYTNIYNNIPNAQIDWKVFCAPFEKSKIFNKDEYDGQNLHKKFDVAFLSPPFYDKELYEGELTSTTNYKNINDWYNHFYKPMFKRAAMAVKSGGYILAYIPDGRMRKEANFVLEGNGFKYLGIVAFRTIVEGKNPQIRDTFVWRSLLKKGFTQNPTMLNPTLQNSTISLRGNTYSNNLIKELVKPISSMRFKLGQNFAIYDTELQKLTNKISSEERFKSLPLDTQVMELPQNIKKQIIINILIYKILMNGVSITKYYLSKDYPPKDTQKIISIDALNAYPIKIKTEINKIINKMGELASMMSMIVCEFSIDDNDVVWFTNIYENKEYICPIHTKMVLNQIAVYKYHSSEKIDIRVQLKELKSKNDKKDLLGEAFFQKALSILHLTKKIGAIKIEKNHYGIEVSISIKEKYRKKDIILSIFLYFYEYVQLTPNNELTYIEVDKENRLYLQVCKLLGLKDITTYGHISSQVFKLSV
uniref:N-acetyltransferase domain-containing protein n=1 Tax=viral metagenome TaxID=1070528 RepID=A0A6C0I058_9ZZZZ